MARNLLYIQPNKYYQSRSRYGNYELQTHRASGAWWPKTVNSIITFQRRRRGK